MFDTMDTLIVLIPALPLAAAVLTALFGKLLKERSHWPGVLAIGGAFVLSVMLLIQVNEASRAEESTGVGWEHTVNLWNWITVDGALARPSAAHATDGAGQLPASLPFLVDITLRADTLTSIMLAMVTFVATLVAIYSAGYMHGDRGYWRFFSYVNIFVFSMTMLVSCSNFVLLYVFWEAVGACSYLLIGYWYEKPEAAAAGKKAFLVNRVGDFGFAIALFLIWTTYGTLNFHDADGIAGILGQTRLSNPGLYVGGGVALAICLLLLTGACGKSAQFPLHVWLPDAMEGPTPVSALIHAATMVTAGVYMVTRCTPLFVASPAAQQVVALVGAVTAAMAGIIAMTQTDLKRVLAYSTVSQLGYMFLGLGVGTLAGITAGMFHLFTHAFFKACLFLGAGSVMHSMGGVIDMRRFSGLRRLMPITHWTFLFGCLALAGVIPFAGFWSKDEILAAAYDQRSNPYYFVLFIVGLTTAMLTATYTFRAYFLTFFGEERVPHEAGHHAHESPPSMTAPLILLAVCSATVGFLALNETFGEFLQRTPSLAYHAAEHSAHDAHSAADHTLVAAISTVVALAGIGLAAFFYLGNQKQVEWLASRLRPLYLLSYGKLFFDELYNVLIVWPIWLVAQVCYIIDRWIIDGLVNLLGKIPLFVGNLLRSLQTGMVQFYALAMVLGLLVLLGTLLIGPK